MLPSSRVIGHKEWAAGRKSDPIYSMAWRRTRVANFVSKNAAPAAQEDDMGTVDTISANALKQIQHAVMEAPVGGLPDTFNDVKDKQGNVMLWVVLHRLAGKVNGVYPDRTDGKHKDDLLGYVLENNKHTWAIRQAVDKVLAALKPTA